MHILLFEKFSVVDFFLFVSIFLSIVFAHLRFGNVTVSATERMELWKEMHKERRRGKKKKIQRDKGSNKNRLTTTMYACACPYVHAIHCWW